MRKTQGSVQLAYGGGHAAVEGPRPGRGGYGFQSWEPGKADRSGGPGDCKPDGGQIGV